LYIENSWRLPTSPIREQIKYDIDFILTEIKDEGYKYYIMNWIDSSKDVYIWIAYELKNNTVNRELINI
jgi:hypothetical protein